MSDVDRYAIDDRPLAGTLQKLDVQQVIDATTERWSNRTLCQVGADPSGYGLALTAAK